MGGSRSGQEEGQGPPGQNLNLASSGNQPKGGFQRSESEDGSDAQSGDSAENGDDESRSHDTAKGSVGSVLTPKRERTASRSVLSWSSLFSVKPLGIILSPG